MELRDRKQIVFTGSYNQDILQGTGEIVKGNGSGISVFAFSPADGCMELLHTCDTPNPSYLEIDSKTKHLYAVNELKEYADKPSSSVSGFSIEPDFSLRRHSIEPTGGTDAAHLGLEEKSGMLAVANFCSGSVCAYHLNQDGTFGPQTGFFQHTGSSVDPVRQKSPHAHAITFSPDGRFLLVPDLGCDEIYVYKVRECGAETSLSLDHKICCAPGAGPRHAVFHPDGTALYNINELNSTVGVYKYMPDTAECVLLQTISTIPENHVPSTCSALKVHPNGKFVYASNRGEDSIAVFAVGSDKTLRLLEWQKTRGRTPRDFDISPDGRFLVAANQDSSSIAVFSIDAEKGTMQFVRLNENLRTITCVKFVAEKEATTPDGDAPRA